MLLSSQRLAHLFTYVLGFFFMFLDSIILLVRLAALQSLSVFLFRFPFPLSEFLHTLYPNPSPRALLFTSSCRSPNMQPPRLNVTLLQASFL